MMAMMMTMLMMDDDDDEDDAPSEACRLDSCTVCLFPLICARSKSIEAGIFAKTLNMRHSWEGPAFVNCSL